jgi:hypothetical protein
MGINGIKAAFLDSRDTKEMLKYFNSVTHPSNEYFFQITDSTFFNAKEEQELIKILQKFKQDKIDKQN